MWRSNVNFVGLIFCSHVLSHVLHIVTYFLCHDIRQKCDFLCSFQSYFRQLFFILSFGTDYPCRLLFSWRQEQYYFIQVHIQQHVWTPWWRRTATSHGDSLHCFRNVLQFLKWANLQPLRVNNLKFVSNSGASKISFQKWGNSAIISEVHNLWNNSYPPIIQIKTIEAGFYE